MPHCSEIQPDGFLMVFSYEGIIRCPFKKWTLACNLYLPSVQDPPRCYHPPWLHQQVVSCSFMSWGYFALLLGPVWRLVYSLNTAGGLFANLDETKKKNIHDPEADHFSILYDLGTMRNKDGVFHCKLCYPELKYDVPWNEWVQNSNPVTESTITDMLQ